MKLALIGYPIDHSLSPLIFKEFFSFFKIDGEYHLISEKISFSQKDDFLYHLKKKGYTGINITMPYKGYYASEYGEDVGKLLGIVNTFSFSKMKAINTDYLAIKSLLSSLKLSKEDGILIIGAGSMAKMMVYYFWKRWRRKKFLLLNRTKDRIIELKNFFHQHFKVNIELNNLFPSFKVVINTVPLELLTGEKVWKYFNLEKLCYSNSAYFLDFVYRGSGRLTYFLDKAREKRYNYLRGEEILLEQARYGAEFLLEREIPFELLIKIRKKIMGE